MPEYHVVCVPQFESLSGVTGEFTKASKVMNDWAQKGWVVASTTAVALPGPDKLRNYRALYVTFMRP